MSNGVSPELRREIGRFKSQILDGDNGVLDPETQHHEFFSGAHGRKLDFDNIIEDSDLYADWISIYSKWITETYANNMPNILIGIANGANRLAVDIGKNIDRGGFKTEKRADKKSVQLSKLAKMAISLTRPDFILFVEDVGTTGGTTETAIADTEELIAEINNEHYYNPKISVAHTWIRNPRLKVLDQRGIDYSAIIHEPLPTYSPEDCINNPDGFCHNGSLFIPRK